MNLIFIKFTKQQKGKTTEIFEAYETWGLLYHCIRKGTQENEN